MKCSKCGQEIPDDSMFCEQCGAQVSQKQRKECMVSVKWLLLATVLFVSSANFWALEMIWYGAHQGYWALGSWYLIPVISFMLFAICMGMVIKKKISWVFMILMFCIFLSNVVIVIIADNGRTEYTTNYSFSMNKWDLYLTAKVGDAWNNVDENDMKRIVDKIKSDVRFNEEYEMPRYEPVENYQSSLQRVEDSAFVICGIEGFMVVLYLIYAFVAYKKGWQC